MSDQIITLITNKLLPSAIYQNTYVSHLCCTLMLFTYRKYLFKYYFPHISFTKNCTYKCFLGFHLTLTVVKRFYFQCKHRKNSNERHAI